VVSKLRIATLSMTVTSNFGVDTNILIYSLTGRNR